MFRRLLIANRGEIAIRVARSAHSMGIRCIGVYSEADRAALHRRSMDESREIGGPLPIQSYLNIDSILSVAKETEAEAIHPGYGFLSEDPGFAERCAEDGIIFVGPPPNAMALTGDKIAARRAMSEAGVPVTQGVDRVLRSADEARSVASELGYPVLFKATAGGGGIGMARVDRPSELAAAWESSRSVARANFGNPDVFLEKYLRKARHVEVQVLLAAHGAGVGFVERECSVQRRHQKLVEETPSPVVAPRLRARLIEVAVRGLRALGYRNAGTVEFLLHEGRFTFNEVNARLQVEHPITEMVTGVDLVRQQLRIAADEGLDSGVGVGSTVPPYYDPLLAKLVVHAGTRALAVRRMRGSVDAFEIRGVHTTLPFHRALLQDSRFVQGKLWTTMIADLRIAERMKGRGPWEERIVAIAAALAADGRLEAGPTYAIERLRPSGWALAGRRHGLSGGAHANPARRRW